MEQKQIKLIGLKVKNNGIIQAAELTPDLLSKRLVLVTGNIGNGKSTLLNAAKIATSGTDAIKKSDVLPEGFIAEALLMDGEVPIYIGVKNTKYQRGEKAGEDKLETYLYTKDDKGKAIQPVIDGVAWTASQYWKALTTELTHSLNDLFSENQTTHRKLIEKLFKQELDALNANEVVARINLARDARNEARIMCQSNGAFMERFQSEGYNESQLDALKYINIDKIKEDIRNAEIEKDRAINTPESEYQLICAKIDANRNKELQRIKDEGSAIRNKINAEKQNNLIEYTQQLSKYNESKLMVDKLVEDYKKVQEEVYKFINFNKTSEIRNEQGKLIDCTASKIQKDVVFAIENAFIEKMSQIEVINKPIEKSVSQELINALNQKAEEYKALESSPVIYPEKVQPDTSAIDKNIMNLRNSLMSAEENNKIFQRYQLWRNWIEAKALYEKEVDELRKLYASIDTGVEGMKIVPRDTDNGKVEVWIMYNGHYNPAYFGNKEKQSRFMFDYSSFQRTIIGLLLQSARLNLKSRALRVAFIDDVAFTQNDISVLTNIAEELNLKLITAWTHEADKEQLMDGQVLVDGGEVFFN